MSRARVINVLGAVLLGCIATLGAGWSAAAFDPELPVPPSAPLLVQTTSGERGRIYATIRESRWRTRIDLLWSPESEAEKRIAAGAVMPAASSANAEGVADAALSWPPHWAKGVEVAPLPNGAWGYTSILVFTGWPLRSFVGAATLGDRLKANAAASSAQTYVHHVRTSHAVLLDGRGAIDFSSFLYAARIVPLRVLWGAFAVNVLVFALVFAAPYEAARFVQRRRRSALNLCRSCGYALTGIGVGAACPECGAAYPPRC